MIKAKIREVFFSLQGEGPYVGTAHIFVRFNACNINCSYCDTQGLQKRKKTHEYSAAELKQLVLSLNKRNKAQYLSLTGGEPLLYPEFIKDFLKKFRQEKIPVYLETNGILYENFAKIKQLVDVVAMDIKLPSSGAHKPFWSEHEKFIKLCTKKNIFFKTVISLKTEKADIEIMVDLLWGAGRNKVLVLQPQSDDLSEKLIKKMIDFKIIAQKGIKDVRIIPQMHKIIGVR